MILPKQLRLLYLNRSSAISLYSYGPTYDTFISNIKIQRGNNIYSATSCASSPT